MEAEYIARISYGKDSLKMLDVIKSRGLPLDRITTTDVWATDTISANLPPVEEFKARMDERIWQLYRMEVEHLCARNPDGSKKTYEQMFYHVPVRRSQTLNVERERERERAGFTDCSSREREKHRQGTIRGFPDLWNPWCQAGLKRTPNAPAARDNHRIPTKHPVQLVSKTQNSIRGRVSRDGRCQTSASNGANTSRHGYQRIPNNMGSVVPGRAQDQLAARPLFF